MGEASDSPTTAQPIYRRAASTKARMVRPVVSLGARSEPVCAGLSSQWFLPVDGMTDGGGDGINVSPQEWVDEWLTEVASEHGSEASDALSSDCVPPTMCPSLREVECIQLR